MYSQIRLCITYMYNNAYIILPYMMFFRKAIFVYTSIIHFNWAFWYCGKISNKTKIFRLSKIHIFQGNFCLIVSCCVVLYDHQSIAFFTKYVANSRGAKLAERLSDCQHIMNRISLRESVSTPMTADRITGCQW